MASSKRVIAIIAFMLVTTSARHIRSQDQAGAPPPPDRPVAEADAKAVLLRAAEAMGVLDALKAIKSAYYRYEAERFGVPLEIETLWREPNRYMHSTKNPEMLNTLAGNGKWS